MLARWSQSPAEIVVLSVVALLCSARQTLAMNDDAPRLTLRVYDYAELAPDVRAETARTVRRIYRASGVETAWRDACWKPTCTDAVDDVVRPASRDALLTVYIRPRVIPPHERASEVMGAAPVGGSVAYAFFDRISGFAMRHDLQIGTALGYVIAHELGHLLLREGHTDLGIMRANWTGGDLTEMRRGGLGFTPPQLKRIRSQVVRMHAAAGVRLVTSAAPLLQ